jgi:hypothetical protein
MTSYFLEIRDVKCGDGTTVEEPILTVMGDDIYECYGIDDIPNELTLDFREDTDWSSLEKCQLRWNNYIIDSCDMSNRISSMLRYKIDMLMEECEFGSRDNVKHRCRHRIILSDELITSWLNKGTIAVEVMREHLEMITEDYFKKIQHNNWVHGDDDNLQFVKEYRRAQVERLSKYDWKTYHLHKTAGTGMTTISRHSDKCCGSIAHDCPWRYDYKQCYQWETQCLIMNFNQNLLWFNMEVERKVSTVITNHHPAICKGLVNIIMSY